MVPTESDARKRQAALAALEHVPLGEVLGVGTGSTVRHFIELLGTAEIDIPAAVASSTDTANLLRDAGIDVVDLNEVAHMPVYVDGADEIDPWLRLIKGGGGALTREKICAQRASTFVCIADGSKVVDRLGAFPLAIEAIPMAERLVSMHVQELGGRPVTRKGFATDNGNPIIDARGLDLAHAEALETALDSFPGVVSSGLFARRRADIALVAGPDGVHEVLPRSTPPL